MCGIAGFIGTDRDRIERMTRALAHRGPDHHAVEITHGSAIGNRRLAILDPRPEGNQPMWNNDHTIVLTYNGEIFNYKELRDAEKFHCRTNTDTEVILQLYERYGMTFLSRLHGMFSFGLFDTRNSTWYLARSSNGILPLFVAFPDGNLHFASEMRAILAGLPGKPRINERALSLYLRLQYVPGPETLCDGIEFVPPGTLITCNGRSVQRSRFTMQQVPLSLPSKKTFREQFPALMDASLREHLVSDRPVGLFLSGGMDSSIVLHHMRRQTNATIRTFTVRFEATEEEGAKRFNTDADLAAKTAQHYGTEHSELLLTAADFAKYYRDTARALDQPNADSVSVAQFLLARMAKHHVDVVLCGAGGDELFGGYPRYRVARILQTSRFIPSGVRAVTGKVAGYPPDVLQLSPGPSLAERLLGRPVAECDRIVRGKWFDPAATTSLFGERFSALHADDPVRAFMEFDRGLWLVDESLRLADAVTLGNGLECRVPFLDPRVIAASHATPSSWHVTLWRTKALLKDTYRHLLPDHLFTLPKASFYPPLAKWIRREAKVLVLESFEHPRIRELFDIAVLRRIFDDHCAHRHYGLHPLSSVTQLRFWFETVYDA